MSTSISGFPWNSDGFYTFKNAKVDGVAVDGGSGQISWAHEDGTPIAGQTWPEAITWNNTLKRYESPISASCVTTLGELVIGTRRITALNGKVGSDVVKLRVKALSP